MPEKIVVLIDVSKHVGIFCMPPLMCSSPSPTPRVNQVYVGTHDAGPQGFKRSRYCPRPRQVKMLLSTGFSAIDAVSRSSRLPLSKEDCDVLNALQRDPEGENEVLYPNQCSLVKGGESEASVSA